MKSRNIDKTFFNPSKIDGQLAAVDTPLGVFYCHYLKYT